MRCGASRVTLCRVQFGDEKLFGYASQDASHRNTVVASLNRPTTVTLPSFPLCIIILSVACPDVYVPQAIFTPGPDELMSREEFEAELAALESEEAARLAEHKESGGGGGLPGQPQEQDGEQRGPPTGLVRRVGGPEAAYELVRRLYSRLFADEVLKGFFAGLSVERLKTKQVRERGGGVGVRLRKWGSVRMQDGPWVGVR